MECYRCGTSDRNVRFFDVIKREGIMKVCENCYKKEDSPVFRKPTEFQLKEIERKPGIYERLSRMAGINPQERRTERPLLINQDTNLRKLVDKNYVERVKKETTPRADLIDNFRWIIMRARRSRKMTQKQFADEIEEPEAAIKMAEEGNLPNDGDKLLNKIQNCLRINLLRNNPLVLVSRPVFENPVKNSDSERKKPDSLSIADLKRIQEERELKENFPEYFKKESVEESDESEEEKPKEKGKKELSEDEIRDLIFKR